MSSNDNIRRRETKERRRKIKEGRYVVDACEHGELQRGRHWRQIGESVDVVCGDMIQKEPITHHFPLSDRNWKVLLVKSTNLVLARKALMPGITQM